MATRQAEPWILLMPARAHHVDIYRRLLEPLDIALHVAIDDADFTKTAIDSSPLLVMVEAQLTDPDPFQWINRLKADKRSAHLPVMLITRGLGDRRLRTHPALAVTLDIMPTPLDPESFRQRVQFFVGQWQLRRMIESLGKKKGNSLIENDKEGLLALDGEGRIRFANHAAQRILKARATQLVGMAVESLFDETRPDIVSHWSEHPVSRVTRGEQILQVDSTTLWRADGEPVQAKYAAIPLKERGEITLVFAFRELRESRGDKARKAFLTIADPLTGLPMRARAEDMLDRTLVRARERNEHIAVLCIDLDHFRYINESLGHELGDQLLVQVAQRIKPLIRRDDGLARVDGDEFQVVLSSLDRPESAGWVARKMVERLAEPYLIDGHEIHVTASIGIAVFPQCGDVRAALVSNASTAMQRVKQQGRNGHQFFSRVMNDDLSARLQLQFDLHRALDAGQMHWVPVPVTDLASGDTVAIQLEPVWKHPTQGDVSWATWAPIADHAGLGVTLGHWQWQSGLAFCAGSIPGFIGGGRCVVVPMPAVVLVQEDAVQHLCAQAAAAGLAPECIIIDVWESSLLWRDAQSRAALSALAARGFGIALGDFGRGVVPLHLLEQMPLTHVRLSTELIEGLRAGRRTVISGLVAVLRGLGVTVLATGIGEVALMPVLRELGVQWVAGMVGSVSVSGDGS